MKWCRSNGRVLTLMLALAFFNFIFLGIEYQFDNMMDLCQYFGQKKLKDYAAFFSSSSSFC